MAALFPYLAQRLSGSATISCSTAPQLGTGAVARAARAAARAWLRDQSGGTLVWFALTMPVILGMAGVGVDSTLWYMDKRILQTAADSGAIAGAHVLAQAGTDTAARQTVVDEISRNDFQVGANDVVTINMPPKTGPNAGVTGFVEVIIDKQRPLYFVSFLRDEPVVIQTRAVSGATGYGANCVLALDRDMAQAIEFKGTADADINCGIAANSRSDSAVAMIGSAALQADAIKAHGDIAIGGSSTLATDIPPQPYASRVNDPYAYLEVPAASPCDETSELDLGNTTITLDPGRYCGGLRITSSDVIFNPGVYIVDGGDFTADGGSTLTGVGVTFILTADVASEIGNLRLTGGVTADLSAPTDPDDPYVGVLFYQDRAADSYQGNQLIGNDMLGGAETNLQGAVYFPNQEIKYSGGAAAGAGCLQLVSRKVSFSANSNILNSADACAAMRVKTIEQTRIALIE